MDDKFRQETEEVLARSKALLDAGDIRGWVQMMAEDEAKMLREYGLGNPAPFRMILAELDKKNA